MLETEYGSGGGSPTLRSGVTGADAERRFLLANFDHATAATAEESLEPLDAAAVSA